MPGREKILLEVCAYSLADALAAQAGGADRVELCADRSADGTTPSYGNIAIAREMLKIKLHVMIRSRAGNFIYSRPEFAAMKKDIEMCNQLGVDGVALGVLLPDGAIDKQRCRELVDLAQPMQVTFHRAFDMAGNPYQSLEDVIEAGCKRILTSGQADSAINGAALIAKLLEQAAGRISIMPGAGIRADNLAELLQITGAREFHTSAYVDEKPDDAQIKKMREIASQLS